MPRVGYPDVDAHRKQHEECSCKLARMVKSVASGEMGAAECVPFISEWLHKHMLQSDQRYASWIRKEPEAVSSWAKRLHRHARQLAAV